VAIGAARRGHLIRTGPSRLAQLEAHIRKACAERRSPAVRRFLAVERRLVDRELA